eukprot:TRINITY_DN19_c0_g1_i1.p1 TRINITY_DN19_c0_g1~~TRINITY_DN19_c0_g1_i1.p1  ORF type:complete len:378 (-),score=111.14 TRINITY_DN19_c0_g1_i1:94-1227(-)
MKRSIPFTDRHAADGGEDCAVTTMEALNFVREGAAEELREWLEAGKGVEGEEMEERKALVFGKATFSLGMSLLLWAVDNMEIEPEKRVQICGDLLGAFPDLIDHVGPDKATALHYAAGNGDLKILNMLLEKGAKLLQDDKDESPLHWACLNGHLDVVKILLKVGCDPNQRGTEGNTCLHYAVSNKHTEVITELLSDPRIDNEARNSAKEIANKRGDKNLLQLFDPEKREILVQVQGLQKELDIYTERVKKMESRRVVEQEQLRKVYQELAEEETAHRETKENIERLKDQKRVKAITEHDLIHALMLEQKAENARLQQKLAEVSLERSNDQRKVDVKVSDLHRTLSSLLAMLETTNLGIITAKTAIEGARPYFQLPKN